MLEVPAAIACADVGDLDAARIHLAGAEQSARLWDGTAWVAAIDEARAHLTAAEGDTPAAIRALGDAAAAFDAAGQPLDADRCRSSAHHLAER